MENKKLGYIEVWPRLTLEPNEKYEYEIFYGRNNELDYGQAKFSITVDSIENFLRLTGYLTSRGWFNRIVAKNRFICERNNPFLVKFRKKRRVYDKEPTVDDLNVDNCLEFKIVVDKKRLNKFRELLKEIPDFKVTWRDLNNGINILR